LSASVAEAVADQVHDVLLNHRLLPGRVDRRGQSFQVIAYDLNTSGDYRFDATPMSVMHDQSSQQGFGEGEERHFS
jgi:hypothetical protein